MNLIINKTDDYTLRLNIKEHTNLDDTFSFKLESRLSTSANPEEFRTVFATTVDKHTLLMLRDEIGYFIDSMRGTRL